MIYTCGIFLFDKAGRLLLCHITGRPFDGSDNWSIPKGLSDPDERHDKAAVRELREETGLVLGTHNLLMLGTHEYVSTSTNTTKTLVGFMSILNAAGDEMACVCNSYFDSGDNVMLPEVDDFRWVSLDDAATMIHSSQLPMLAHAKTLCENYIKS